MQARHQAVLASYLPSVALDMNNWLTRMHSVLDDHQLQGHLDKLSRATNRAHRLGLLVALKTEGIILKVADQPDVEQFRERLIRFGQLIDREDQLRKQVEKLKKQHRRRGLSTDEKHQIAYTKQAASQDLLNTRHERAAVLRLIESSIEPTTALSAGYIQVRLDITDAQRAGLQEETRRLQAGLRGGYATPGAYQAAFKSSWAPLLLGTLQAMNLGEAWRIWRRERNEGTGSIRKDILFASALTSVLVSSLTVYQVAHIAMLDNVMQTLSTGVPVHSGSLTAVKIGKLGLGYGATLSFLALFINSSTALNNYSKWQTAITQGTPGEKIGALIGFSGDLGVTGTSMIISATAGHELLGLLNEVRKVPPEQKKLIANQAWATRGTRFLRSSARLNIWGLAFMALQMAGEAIYNYYHLDDLQRWLSGCLWGRQSKGWSETESKQKLAESTLRPTLVDKGIVTDTITNEPVRSLHLILPGLTIDSLETDALRWKVMWRCLDENLDVSDFFRHKLSSVSDSPAILELKLSCDYLGHQVFLDLCLAVKPLLADQFLKADAGYLNYRVPLGLDNVNHIITAMALAPDISAPLPAIKITKSFINDQQ